MEVASGVSTEVVPQRLKLGARFCLFFLVLMDKNHKRPPKMVGKKRLFHLNI
jgi:hypothetical protein